MSKRRRKRSSGMMGVIGFGASAPIALAMGTGLASQVKAASGPGVGPSAITGAVYTGMTGSIGMTLVNKALKKAKKYGEF
jgi:hypothetical protein